MGFAEGWARDSTTQSGHAEFETEEAAKTKAKGWNDQCVSGNVTYIAKEFGS